MPRQSPTNRVAGKTVLLVDDDVDYLQITRMMLEHEGHQVLTANNGPEGLNLLRDRPVDLLLLDYFMPGMTGEEVVARLREFNPFVQVILQTGYASERPPRDMLRRLDIQGYHDKTEGPEKLLLWVDVGLKAAYTVQLLSKSRQGLRYILDVTPELHKIQPLQDLLQGVLFQVSGLLGVLNSFLAILPEGGILRPSAEAAESFIAMIEDEAEMVIRASTGRFAGHSRIDQCLEQEQIQLVRQTLQVADVHVAEAATIVPLRVGELTVGVIYFDRPVYSDQDMELLHIFANQAAVAIQNAQLYEIATLDRLTGAYVRHFFDRWLLRELRTAFRSLQPLALLMVDLDGMKQINDTAGHLAGDQALALVGRLLRQATRDSDIVGRYGGDEFTVILPQTRFADAERVGQRVLDAFHATPAQGAAGLSLRASMGVSVLEAHAFAAADIPRPIPQSYFQEMAQSLIQYADEALYQAKHAGGNRLVRGAAAAWQPTQGMPPGDAG